MTHQIRNRTINVQPENQNVIIVKKGRFAKACKIEHQKRQEIKEIIEPEDTEEKDTDKLIKMITELKHVSTEEVTIP